MRWLVAAGAYVIIDQAMQAKLGLYWAAPVVLIGLYVKSEKVQIVVGLCYAGLLLWCISKGASTATTPASVTSRA